MIAKPGAFLSLKMLSANIIIMSSMLDDVSKLPVDQDNTGQSYDVMLGLTSSL